MEAHSRVQVLLRGLRLLSLLTSIVFTTLEGQEAKCSVVIEMTIIRTTKIRYEDDDNYNFKKLQQYPQLISKKNKCIFYYRQTTCIGYIQ